MNVRRLFLTGFVTLFMILAVSALSEEEGILCAVLKDGAYAPAYNAVGGRQIGTLFAGRLYPVTGKEGDQWLRVMFDSNGTQAYIGVSPVETRTVTEDYVETGDAPAFTVTGDIQARPGSLKEAKDLTVSGVITSSLPLSSIELRIYDNRLLADEMTSRAVFFRNDGVTEFDLSTLTPYIKPGKLAPGEKILYITACSGNARFTVAENHFYIEGENGADAHITNLCALSDEGALIKLTDGSVNVGWRPVNGDTIALTVPDGQTPAVLLLKWKRLPETYTLVFVDGSGAETETVSPSGDAIKYVMNHAVPGDTREIRLTQTDTEVALGEMYLYAEGRVPDSVQNWRDTPEKMDLMLISAHQDDEFLFFGGSIPYYVERGKAVGVTYMANCGRDRYDEAFDALWAAGLTQYPVFLGLYDKKTTTLAEAQNLWKGDAVVALLVEQLRKYKPEVVVTHDFKGEYLHYQHIVTVNAVAKAVTLAADQTAYPESAAQYGVWTVKKLYVHLYQKDTLHMDWDVPSVNYPGMTIRDVSYMAYNQNYTQTFRFSMRVTGKRYDNTDFGLYYTTVGPDLLKNDFFENIP